MHYVEAAIHLICDIKSKEDNLTKEWSLGVIHHLTDWSPDTITHNYVITKQETWQIQWEFSISQTLTHKQSCQKCKRFFIKEIQLLSKQFWSQENIFHTFKRIEINQMLHQDLQIVVRVINYNKVKMLHFEFSPKIPTIHCYWTWFYHVSI